MKKELTILLLLITLSINLSLALELEVQNTQPAQGETFLAKITTDFQKPIYSSDIEFYQGRKQVTFEYDLTSHENTYYFYIYLNKQGNFTLKINNILYKEDTLKSKNIEYKFSITEQNKSLSIKPGFLTTSNKELFLKNTGNENLEINYKYQDQEQLINLTPEQSTTLQLNPTQSLSFITLETYQTFTIPLIYFNINQQESTPLQITPSLFWAYASDNPEYSEIEIYNPNNYNITELQIITHLEFLNITAPSIIPAKTTIKPNISIKKFNEGYIKSNITFTYKGLERETKSIPLEIYSIPENKTIQEITKSQSCEELQGIICVSGYTCEGDYVFAQGELCCLSECIEAPSYNPFEPKKNDKEGYGWLWAIIIFIILAIIGFFIYKKFKKSPANQQDPIKTKAKQQEQRLTGGLARN